MVVAYWTKEEKMKKTFVKIIQQLYVVNLKEDKLIFPNIWNNTWA